MSKRFSPTLSDLTSRLADYPKYLTFPKMCKFTKEELERNFTLLEMRGQYVLVNKLDDKPDRLLYGKLHHAMNGTVYLSQVRRFTRKKDVWTISSNKPSGLFKFITINLAPDEVVDKIQKVKLQAWLEIPYELIKLEDKK